MTIQATAENALEYFERSDGQWILQTDAPAWVRRLYDAAHHGLPTGDRWVTAQLHWILSILPLAEDPADILVDWEAGHGHTLGDWLEASPVARLAYVTSILPDAECVEEAFQLAQRREMEDILAAVLEALAGQ